MSRFIIVTGGVLSGLGKGIAAASIGRLLAGYRVIPMKLDGYLNVDPGTMNPVEHGEVFVLDDGAEVDMDFGHYERFLGVSCKRHWNLTMGRVFDEIRRKERRGEFLGQTVQFIPHVTDHIKRHLQQIAQEEHADVVLVEVGGTVGDIENELYIEACRQLGHDLPGEVLYVHLTYVPILDVVGEQKSKPTQQSIQLLHQRGVRPDVIIGRCRERINDGIKRKIATFCGVPSNAVITGLDVESVYTMPLLFHEEGLTQILEQKLGLSLRPDLETWTRLLTHKHTGSVAIAICGKYTALEDSYASVIEALRHAAAHLHLALDLHWVDTTDVRDVGRILDGIDGVIVPGGFGSRGIEGKIAVVRHCREHDVPFLGLCYGMQLAVIEHARNVLGLDGAHTTEVDPATPHPVVDLLPEQRAVDEKGATMRLGGHDVRLVPGTRASAMFGSTVRLRFRHRYEVNPDYVNQLASHGLVFSGSTADGRIKQVIERVGHTFFMATQAHPELTSRLESPSQFFLAFLNGAVARKRHTLLNV